METKKYKTPEAFAKDFGLSTLCPTIFLKTARMI
jgi:hypothetical protein